VDENLVVQVRLNFACLFYKVSKFDACTLILLLLSVDHINKCSTLGNLSGKIVLQHIIAREVDHIEVNIVIGIDLLSFDNSR
jgi:hypothetical protein